MLLYHGSPTLIPAPSLSMARGYRDFGCGFYLAEDEIDSLTYCFKGDSSFGFLHTYEVDEDCLLGLPGALSFDDKGDEWLRVVYECRMFGHPTSFGTDPAVIAGPTAGMKVNDVFRRYRKEGTSFEDCVDELRRSIVTDKYGIQWCLRSTEAVQMLHLIDRERVWRDEECGL